MKESRPKILIVDDEPVICELLKSELEEQNYICKTASDGKDALDKLKMNKFDLVLLDIKLPDIPGTYVLEEVTEKYTDTSVIMVTGVIDVEVAVVAMQIGASDYIVKPIDLDKLTESVTRTLHEREYQSNIEVRSRKTYPEEENRSVVEDSVINELDAISLGVEQRIDHIIGSFKIVTERTVQIAQKLKMPEEKIRLWKARRMKSGLDKKTTAYNPRKEEEQKSVTYTIMNAIKAYL